MGNTILIFGCSERILEIEKQIPALVKNYDTIGLNAFPLYYKTKYWLWMDNPDKGNVVYKCNKGIYENFYKFTPNEDLFGAYTVTSFALDFAIKRGYEKAVLYGILDGNYNYNGNKYIHAGQMQFSYRHFYDQQEQIILMQKLQQFKQIILSYKNRIKLEIPYKNI